MKNSIISLSSGHVPDAKAMLEIIVDMKAHPHPKVAHFCGKCTGKSDSICQLAYKVEILYYTKTARTGSIKK